MRKVGDYQWDQLSMWDFAPDNCVESYVRSDGRVLHFCLKQICELVAENHWRTRTVTEIGGVPDEVLGFRNGDVYLRKHQKTTLVKRGGIDD